MVFSPHCDAKKLDYEGCSSCVVSQHDEDISLYLFCGLPALKCHRKVAFAKLCIFVWIFVYLCNCTFFVDP